MKRNTAIDLNRGIRLSGDAKSKVNALISREQDYTLGGAEDNNRFPIEFIYGNIITLQTDCLNDGTAQALRKGDRLICASISKEEFFMSLTSKPRLMAFRLDFGVVIGEVSAYSFGTEGLYIRPLNLSYIGMTSLLKDIEEVYEIAAIHKKAGRRKKTRIAAVEYVWEKGYKADC